MWRYRLLEFLTLCHEDVVAIVTLNRPRVLNAWHAPMREELIALMAQLDADPTVDAIVLTGAGERAFGAGQDLNESKTFEPGRAASWMDEWKRLYNSVRKCSTPTVVALNGACAGSAFQIALMADMRVGHPGIRMGQPEINSGVASTVGPWIIREFAGLRVARNLTLTGRLLDAEEALALGFVDHLVPAEAVLETSIAKARELAAKPKAIMRLDKERFVEMTEEGFLGAVEAGERIQKAALESGETARVNAAFLNKTAKGAN
jgi:enoyl-CoA hydratase/carnithine racemase